MELWKAENLFKLIPNSDHSNMYDIYTCSAIHATRALHAAANNVNYRTLETFYISLHLYNLFIDLKCISQEDYADTCRELNLLDRETLLYYMSLPLSRWPRVFACCAA